MKNSLSASIAAALLLASLGASASTLTINPTPATALPGAGNPTVPAQLQVAYNNTTGGASTVSGLEFEITFDDVDLNLTVTPIAPYSCVHVAGSGLVTIIGFDGGGVALPSANVCTLTFTTAAGAADLENKPLTFQNIVASGNNNVAPVATPGRIEIRAVVAAPPTINFAPNGGAVPLLPSTIAVTTSGGDAGGTASYNCTVPAGYTVTNSSGVGIATGANPPDMDVSCVAGTPDTSMTCTRTGGVATNVVFNLDCPAAPAPVLTSTPASGTALTCNGAAGSTVTTSVTISNTGNANMTGVACNVVGAGFVLTTPPAAVIPGPGSSTAVVSCTVPADGAAPTAGTLNCTTAAPAGGALTFPLSSVAQSSAIPTQPDIIPANSLWSKLGLIGLLAALGMLAVGFRRQQ